MPSLTGASGDNAQDRPPLAAGCLRAGLFAIETPKGVGGRVSTPPSPLNLTYRDVALKIFDPTRDPGEPPRQEVFLTYDRHTRPTPRHG